MEFSSLLIIAIVVIYATKNAKGKKVAEHCGNTMVHLAASADKASAALERQCDLLLSDEEMAEASAKAKAKLAKAKADNVADDYSDIL